MWHTRFLRIMCVICSSGVKLCSLFQAPNRTFVLQVSQKEIRALCDNTIMLRIQTNCNVDMTLLTALLGSWFNQWSNAWRGWEKILGYSHQGTVKSKPSVIFHYFLQVYMYIDKKKWYKCELDIYRTGLSLMWPVADSVFVRSLALFPWDFGNYSKK